VPAATGIAATVITTTAGVIEWVDPSGARLLNTAARSCAGRDLLRFFARDRMTLLASMRAAASGQVIESEATIRPRDRKPVAVALRVALDPDAGGSLKWIFTVQAPVPAWLLGS
jgi:hypothetical protein